MMLFSRKSLVSALALALALTLQTLSLPAQQDATFPAPSDDRWHYPFNFTPGVRPNATIFTASNTPDFDYYDGVILLRFSLETGQPGSPDVAIPTGLPPASYEFTGAEVTIQHDPGTIDPYTWDTRPATLTPPNGAGQPFELKIFGVGLDDDFTEFTLDEWTETSPYFGQQPGPTGDVRRNPHPLNIDDQAAEQSVSNDPAAPAWGTGEPVYGSNPGEYTPGAIAPAPFPVTFTVDVSNPRVKAYIQEGLAQGYIDWALVASVDAAMMSANTNVPRFFFKEDGTVAPASFVLRDFQTPAAVDGWNLYE
jgi:hypothetical protein